ncbi:hypothetical protein Vretimale_10992 [Volvox reticuliferus]|uniref:Uncharacterized protein n=1 Tax=Volvox reticuliferus TaxID=1737510 RepID=A0A8J4GGS3_9CHLO|nr:hypothetical protein Vretimale_10992 [Volvox reticuliferus]
MLRLGPSDRYASFQLVVVAISLGVRLTLPGKWSMLLRTSVLSQLHRLIPLSYLLVASYYGVPPSSSGRRYLLTHPVLDFLSNIVFPVHPISECVFCATSMLLTIAIWWRYGYLATSNFGSASTAMLAGGAQGADNTCIDDVTRSSAALAAGATLPGMAYEVVTATAGAGADAVNNVSAVIADGTGNMSSYHLGRWLPFQLLMNLVALIATLLLEWWRGPPDELVTTEPSMFSWLQRTDQGPSRLGELGECCGDSAAHATAAADTGSGRKAKANAAVAICTPARPNVQHTVIHERCGSSDGDGAREPRDGGRNGDGFGSNMKLIASLAEPNSTDANEAVRQLRPLCSDDVVQRPEALLEPTAPPPSIEAVSDVLVGADATRDSWGCGGADSNVAANDRNHDEADPDHDMENGSTGHGDGAADMGYDSARNVATDMAAVEAEARDVSEVHVLRWSTGVPVQAALGSPSSLGPALFRDSEILAELGGPDAGDQESGVADRAAGPRSDGSSRVDVARHDQQVRSGPLPLLPPTPALVMSGGGVDGATEGPAAALPPSPLLRTSSGGSGDARVWIVDGARTAAAAVGPAIPAPEPFPSTGHGVEADVVVAAASVVVRYDDSIEDDTPGRDHNRAHRLLSSLSSRASQSPTQHNSHTHLHSHSSQQHIHAHGRLESQSLLQLQFQGYWHVADQLMDDRTVPPQPQQPQQRQYISHLGFRQNVWPLSAPDGSFSTATVMAAVQHARRPAYVPRVRLMTTHIKVHGAQPDQLQSGYTQRLENVATAAGQRLMGVYVRAGCIELVLDSADWVDGDIPSEAMPQSGGRDSGPLPAPLQPRPLPYPPYWSAPNTPSRLQHEQQQQQQTLLSQALQTLQPPLQRLPTHDGAKYQQQGGAATQPQISYSRAPQDAAVVVSPGSASSHGSAACLGLAPIPAVIQRGGGAATVGQGQGHGSGYGHGGGGSRSSMQGGGGDSGIGTDLDLGAVIRALRLRRTEGSADSINDLVSEHDMDLEFGDRVDNSTSGPASGGLGVEASSKETSVGSGGRRGVGGGGADADTFSPAALGLTATGGSVTTHPRFLQQLQQQVLLQQQQQQQRLQDAGAVMPAMPPPPPQPQLVAASAVGPISRQALVLGGPRDPMAPGIISLNPRVLVILPRASSVIGGGSNEEIVVRLSAVVRRVSTIPLGAVTSNVAGAAAGLDPEFTMRVRGEYLPLRAVRLESTTVATRVGLVLEPPRIGSAPRGGGGSVSMPTGGIGGGGLGGEDGVLPMMMVMGSGERLQDTSSDIDTGYHYHSEGGRPVPAAWMWHESFLLELLEPPQCPGLLLVDLRGGGGEPAAGRAPNRAMPLVAVADADAAAELQAAVESWEGTQSELDDLLLDLGTWLHHMSRPSPQVVPSAGLHEAEGGPAAAAAVTVPILDQRLVALGQHLLSYAEVCGWRATAAALQDDLAKHGIPRAYTNGRSSSPTILQPVWSPSKVLAGTVPSAIAPASVPAVADVAPASLGPIPQRPQPHLVSGASIGGKARGAVSASRRIWVGLLPLRILAWRGSTCGQGVGFMDLFSFGRKLLWSGATPEEREGFKAFQRAYISQQIWLICPSDSSPRSLPLSTVPCWT